MKKQCILIALSWSGIAFADLVRNPDANTLWLENGKNVEKNWSSAGIARISGENGFSLECQEKDVKKSHSAVLRAPCSPEYPWLVFRIADIQLHPGYRSWAVILQNPAFRTGQTSVNAPGIFAFNVYDGALIKGNPAVADIFFYLYTLRLSFTELKMVKKPDNYAEAASPVFAAKKSFEAGDSLRFTVTLKEPAEDVSVRILYTDLLTAVKLNGQEKLQLKPVDKDQKIWSGEFEIKTFGPARGKTSFPRGSLLIRATVLGGGVSEPIWGSVNYPFVGGIGK
ncbi:MAG: hypothetical protein BWY31_03931 [Lentisphaerae bacterium ADurb.Bin242]|nr:MAG: hypothetical protein BWY31_03931 [Lentisphaerae bacterium ADurb.Bin242]